MNTSRSAYLCALLLAGCSNNHRGAIEATGTIESTEVTISAQAGGPVQRLLIDEGSLVQTGDTLVVIDGTDWRFQYDQARAGFAQAEAQYALVMSGARQEDVAQADATYKNAEADLQRMEQLWKEKSITQKQIDDARTRWTVAQQTLEKLRRGSRKEEIRSARARMEQARAQMEALRKKVDDCIVRSPISGAVTKRFVEAGELAGTGTALVRVANLKEMDLTIYVSETELPNVALGQPAQVRIDAFPDRDFEGRVIYISPTAEFTPKNIQTKDERTKLVFAVKLRVPNPDGLLKAGIPADVRLPVQAR